MNKLAVYQEMKDSGISWIGKVPIHWEIKPVKAILENCSEKNHPDEEVLSLYRDLGVVPKNSRDDNHNVTSEDTSQYKFVRAGNLVINKMKAWQGSLAVSDFTGIVSPAYYVCAFKDSSASKKFFHYLLRSAAYAQEFEKLSTGMRIGQWDLGIKDFMRVPAIVPPSMEQQAIAGYLDEAYCQIDSIIAEAKASIEDYKQWKASIIYEAVTKGLDPNVEMKDSGVEWIGKVPKHWMCCRQKHVITLINGRAFKDSEFEENGKYRILRVGNLFSNPKWYTSSLELEQDKYCDNGDLLYAWSMSYGPIIWSGEKVIYHYHIWKTKLSSVLSKEFVYYYLIALSNNIRAEAHATTMGFVTMGSMNNSYIAYPGIEEQNKISAHLDSMCRKIDALIETKNQLITDLEFYKKSLIYEVVTGKRKVV